MKDSNKIFADNFKRITQKLAKDGHTSQTALAKKLGVSQKTISNINIQIEEGRQIRLDTIQTIANSLKIDMWKLFVPNIPVDLLLNKELNKVIENYISAPPESQEYIKRVAEKEASYSKKNKDEKNK